MSLTPEQIAKRLGRFNASTVEALCKPKGIGEGGLTYINEKISEIKTGEIKSIFVSQDMQRGLDLEHEALSYLGSVLKLPIEKNENTLINDELNFSGTPDALIKAEDLKSGIPLFTGAEIKCPGSANHITYALMDSGIELKKVEPKYYWQIVGYMLLTGFDSWFFVSYDPRFILQREKMFIFSINRNEEDVNFLKNRLIEANEILQNKLKKF